ncbi:hypothetical protein D3C78_1656880 [compost metagenome]
MAVAPGRHKMHDSRFAQPLRNQAATALLQHADEGLLQGVDIDVGEVHIEELYATDLLQLLVDPASRL